MSLGGNYHGLVIVDDYSRFPWTMFLKTKNVGFDVFHRLAKVIQNEKGFNIVSIRSDHGGEFERNWNSPQFFCPKNTSRKWCCGGKKQIS